MYRIFYLYFYILFSLHYHISLDSTIPLVSFVYTLIMYTFMIIWLYNYKGTTNEKNRVFVLLSLIEYIGNHYFQFKLISVKFECLHFKWELIKINIRNVLKYIFFYSYDEIGFFAVKTVLTKQCAFKLCHLGMWP